MAHAHRIREAMRRSPFTDAMRGTVMADETYIGGKVANRHKGRRDDAPPKVAVLTLVHSETGEARSQAIPNVTADVLRKAISAHVDMRPSVLVSDELKSYKSLSDEFTDHIAVNHSWGTYVNHGQSTNAVEGFFAQMKRSLDGTHHHVSVEHLDRYLAEFDFRYSTCKMTDTERMDRIIGNVAGRRLVYRASSLSSPALVA